MQAVRELLEVGERARELEPCPLDALVAPGVGIPEAVAEIIQSLLWTLAQAGLEAAALLVGGGEQPPPRGHELLCLRTHLLAECDVRRGQPRRGGDRRDHARVSQDGRVVHEHGEWLALAVDSRDGADGARPGKGERGARIVEVGARVRGPVAEHERAVAEHTRKPVA